MVLGEESFWERFVTTLQHGHVLDANHYRRSNPLKWSKEFSQMQTDFWNAWKSSK